MRGEACRTVQYQYRIGGDVYLDIVEPLIRQFGDVALPVLKLLLGELADEERSEELVVPVQEACSKLERC